jgi:endonuclease/exonuclease/phosphatase family metal-dependent hydrolase/glycosyltransferase involved in cell wall biosynthesis
VRRFRRGADIPVCLKAGKNAGLTKLRSMNIVMMTNTYLPHVGGVARSVETFTREYRARSHRVIIVAPEFEGRPAEEVDVIRVPAIQNFNGSDFSLRLPLPGFVASQLAEFKPDIIHAHHPFLLGENAMRLAAADNVPLVFTHHTMYEQYTHYVPGDSPALRRFVVQLTTDFANLCDRVFAPSESVASVIRDRGVIAPLTVVPTGVDITAFGRGDGAAVRRELSIPGGAFVVGHVGRLAPEKNLEFLADAVGRFVRSRSNAHFLVVGSGPSEEAIRRIFERHRVADRLHMPGSRSGQALVDSYHAMDVFAFASHSETQGMVLVEAMAAGRPVVAIDAPGVREVIVDRQNGRMLASQNRRAFVAALDWVAAVAPHQRERLEQIAHETAERFSTAACAEKALEAYEQTIAAERQARNPNEGRLESVTRLIGVEWELWTNVARATGRMVQGRHLWKMPILGKLMRGWRRFRRRISRNEWGPRILGLPTSEGTATEPGIILVQIDGFSQTQLERALRRGRMPFLRKLMAREHFRLHTLYSGLPATTPAVQGELFYGVRQIVPAFSFRERETGKAVWMIDPDEAARVQQRLIRRGAPLLEGGSSYSNIYTGGAAEPHFCASVMGWGDLFRNARPSAILLLALVNIAPLFRAFLLCIVEVLLALFDTFYGIVRGRHVRPEFRVILSRVAIGVLLRDLITIGMKMDAARGLPILHCNFLGYDEQAHRRGPGSNYAHWSLRGIDRAIKRIWKAAHRSTRRDYQLWVYADHGQMYTDIYEEVTGRSLNDAVNAIFHTHAEHVGSRKVPARGIGGQRAAWLGGGRAQRVLHKPRIEEPPSDERHLIVTALGPLGYIYTPTVYPWPERAVLAERLVHEGLVPLVVTLDDNGQAQAFTSEGRFPLPQDGVKVLGDDHPFLADAVAELAALCHHPDAGSFIVCGFKKKGASQSFVLEHGAHAGPGPEETRGFCLLPPDAAVDTGEKGYLRPLDLRAGVLLAMRRMHVPVVARPRQKRQRAGTVRLLTYNVHTCIGMDGRLSPRRIARVIAQCDPDIVALQECDVRRRRTDGRDQVRDIAEELEMEFHFHPAMRLEEEEYGDAVLSYHPMRLVRAGRLPGIDDRPQLEPRGALWVDVTIDGHTVQVINTHLGLSNRERMAQVEALLGEEWIGQAESRGPCILCGDFNALPGSPPYRRLLARLRDAQLAVNGQRPLRTWFSHYPIGRIDHVFVTGALEVVSIEVPHTELIRTASDHLPLVAEIRLP